MKKTHTHTQTNQPTNPTAAIPKQLLLKHMTLQNKMKKLHNHSFRSDLIIIQQSAKTFRKFYYMQLDTASSIMELTVITCLKDKY